MPCQGMGLDVNMPVIRKLEGVSQKVTQYLLQAGRVPHQVSRKLFVHEELQLYSGLDGRRFEKFAHLAHGLFRKWITSRATCPQSY